MSKIPKQQNFETNPERSKDLITKIHKIIEKTQNKIEKPPAGV